MINTTAAVRLLVGEIEDTISHEKARKTSK